MSVLRDIEGEYCHFFRPREAILSYYKAFNAKFICINLFCFISFYFIGTFVFGYMTYIRINAIRDLFTSKRYSRR